MPEVDNPAPSEEEALVEEVAVAPATNGEPPQQPSLE